MLQLKNQFIFAPIKTGYSDGTGVVTERHLAFYKRRAQYLGAVIPEPFYMDKGLRELPTQMGIDKDDKIEGLQKLVATIHESGTKVIAHFNHPGRMANPKIPGNYFLSSTDSPCENGGSTPRRMEREDMKKVVDLFVEAAVRAEKANFDVIELQFGHGYLLAQFISPFVNDRKDEFGEDMEAIAKTLSLKMMKEKGTVFSDHTHIKRVEGRTVYAERSAKNIRFDDVDVIVVSTSMKSYNPLEKELEDKMPVYVIGDAREVGNAQDAIRDAYETAKEL
ncbi:NADPH dehydrogenase [subsurface metagenome]